MNGQDILAPQLGVIVPVFSKKYRSQKKQLYLEKQSNEEDQLQLENQLERLLDEVWVGYQTTLIEMENQQKIIEESKRIVRISLVGYQTTGVSYDKLIDYEIDVLNHQLKLLELEQKLLQSKSYLDYLTK